MDVGQRQIISKKKRQAVILIFYVERAPDILGILMNETEHTLICAGHRLNGFEFQSKGLPFTPDECDLTILCLDSRASADNSSLELKVNDVQQRLAVQLMNLVTSFQSNAFGNGSGIYDKDTQLLWLAGAVQQRVAVFVLRLENLPFEILIISLPHVSGSGKLLLGHFNTRTRVTR